jgi:hypothetical protein
VQIVVNEFVNVYLNMNPIKNIISVTFVSALIACNSSEGEGNVQLNQAAQPLPVATTPPSVDTSKNNRTTIAQPVQSVVALNPAHGLPGHRCDIAVGAPLNSPANANGPAPVQMQTPQTNAPVMQQAPMNAGGVKLNPPHGQPGHDCSIEVGKPLRQQ